MENMSEGGENGSWTWNDWNRTENGTGNGPGPGNWNSTNNFPHFCQAWEPAQHNLFQTANLFFVTSFLIPRNLKHNIILIRLLLGMGFMMMAVWGGFNVCGIDIMLWNLALGCVNLGHAVALLTRLLPPRLSLDLTELYLKLFKPLKVGRKHFKQLSSECQVLKLPNHETYAVEEVTSADDKLSILIKGRMKVSCGDTLLHYIEPFQFVDSPEWEAFRESSADVFQVTICAEEDCTYVCWPRLRLERVLRHRPMLRQVFESMIGKDITHKLYCLNEHLGGLRHENDQLNDMMRNKLFNRSLSVDAVNTVRTGQIRSKGFKQEDSVQVHGGSPNHAKSRQCDLWTPVVAQHFSKDYPFTHKIPAGPVTLPRPSASASVTMTPQRTIQTNNVAFIPVVLPLLPPGLPTPTAPLRRHKTVKRPHTLRRLLSKEKEVKFDTPV